MIDSIERVLATEAIKVLKARYFRFVDTQSWDELRQLFADDAVLSFPETGVDQASIDDFTPAVAKMLAGGVTIHHGHMPEIEILTESTARAIWAMDDLLFFPPGVTGIAGASEIRGFGHYHETYVKQDGRWLFKTMRLTRLRLEVTAQPRAVTS